MVPCIKTKSLSVFFLIVLLLIPLASAESSAGIREADLYKASPGSNQGTDLFSVLSVKTELYNQKFDEVPLLFRQVVGSQQIAGRIKLANGEMLYVTFLMTGGKVMDLYRYDTPDDPYAKFEPSMIIETDEQTMRKIIDSNDPLREAVDCMNDNTLQVKTEGLFRNAALWALKELYS
jgi:hypothetical protein